MKQFFGSPDWHAVMEPPRWIEGRRIRLCLFETSRAHDQERLEVEPALRKAIALFEDRLGAAAEGLVADQLSVIGVWRGFEEWRAALCGVYGAYVSAFDTPAKVTPTFVALELYGAAGVSKTCREQGIRSMDKIASLQRIALWYQDHFLANSDLPEEWHEAIHRVRAYVPTAHGRKPIGMAVGEWLLWLRQRGK